MNIGIIGNGFVGAATKLFKCSHVKAYVYDILPEKCDPIGLTFSEMLNQIDIVFICLPTPMSTSGECHTAIIEKVINDIRQSSVKRVTPHIILRSTVPPGVCERLSVHHMPEFLTEKNWKSDFENTGEWIVGLNHAADDCDHLKKLMELLLLLAKKNGNIQHNNVTFCTTRESEMVKYVRNAFLATKVSFFNEMEEFCCKSDIDFEKVRKMTVSDNRIGESHTKVPGIDGNRGFAGTCLPKDAHSLLHEMQKIPMTSFILENVLKRNEECDRPQQEWKKDPRSYLSSLEGTPSSSPSPSPSPLPGPHQ